MMRMLHATTALLCALSCSVFAQVGGVKPGNGHMLMIEKNNLEIADFINKWISKTVK